MARQKKERKINMSNVNKKLDLLDLRMDDIYQKTYSSTQDNTNALNKISDQIYDTVDDILNKNGSIQDVPDISNLYTRLKGSNNENINKNAKGAVNDIQDIFNNRELLDTISTNTSINRYIKSLDDQYDLICRYMPKLERALQLRKDNILCSDNFSKEYINFSSISMDRGDKKNIFANRMDELKRIYHTNDLIEEIYDDASRYGEYFLYCVPYKKAFERLMNNKNNTQNGSMGIQKECSMTLVEHGNMLDRQCSDDVKGFFKNSNNDIHIDFSYGILDDAINECTKLRDLTAKSKATSLRESFLNEAKLSDPTIPDNLEYDKLKDEYNTTSSDGFVNVNQKKNTIDNIPGCVVKKLIHYNVIPWGIDNTVIGYLYFKFTLDQDPDNNTIVNSATYPSHIQYQQDREDIAMKYVAKQISDMIDSDFINSNQDLAEEIYTILKYNEDFNINENNNIKVVFLPAEDVYHFYFRLDPKTRHGISDLRESLIPATFYCLLKLTTTLGQVTRGLDKRIYYVKQNVDTNVARTLMNVVNQVKKGNFGIRQLESMNNILNVVGRYNDHVVPVGPSGDSPIQFEILEGQRIETPTDLLDAWEEEAVGQLLPLEFVNTATQVDYAARFTMSSSTFLKTVLRIQSIIQPKISDIITRIYNYHYNETESYINARLSQPIMIAASTGAQIIASTKDYVQQLADIKYPEDSPAKLKFIQLTTMDLLGGIVDTALLDKNAELADIESATENNEE